MKTFFEGPMEMAGKYQLVALMYNIERGTEYTLIRQLSNACS